MASHIIMSYLLLIDTQRDESYSASMEIFIDKAKSWNNERFSYVNDFTDYKLGSFLSVKGETSIEA